MSTRTLRVAIVGCGPWGLCVLERLHASATRAQGRLKLVLHVVEPGPPGVGVYGDELPEYLLLNTPCGQIDLYASKILNPDLDFSGPRLGFFEWLSSQDYRVREPGHASLPEATRPVRRADFVPRRWLGRYLRAVFHSLVRSLPPNVTLHVHPERATGIPAGARCEHILLQHGGRLQVDYAFLTLGHGESPAEQSQPRRVDASGHAIVTSVSELAPGAVTAVSGFGLTAIDTLAHLTLGTGGRFLRDAAGVRYVPSGREPCLYQFSRSGIPYRTRPHGSGDLERDVGETLLDARPLRGLRRSGARGRYREELLPFVLREMTARFDAAQASLAEETPAAFDPERELFGQAGQFADGADYEHFLTRAVTQDLAASRLGTACSPLKAGLESLRGLREVVREVVDFGGLEPESFADFRRSFVPQVYRSIVGPPTQKMAEWLALRRAGILRCPFGPEPHVQPGSNCWRLGSRHLRESVSLEAGQLLSGFGATPPQVVEGSALLRGLLADGRARLADASGSLGCGLELDSGFHPIGRAGQARRLFVLGLLSEGARTFNLYVPSPGSRFRAFTDMQRCVDELFAEPVLQVSASPAP